DSGGPVAFKNKPRGKESLLDLVQSPLSRSQPATLRTQSPYAMQNTNFDPDGASDRDVLPRTPTLAGSTSSLDDSLLQSPFSTRFLGASVPSPTKRFSYPGPRIPLEGSCRAWWGERMSTDSSDWRASLDLRPHGPVSGGISSHAGPEPLKSSPSQSDETASATPAPTPSCGRSVSGAKVCQIPRNSQPDSVSCMLVQGSSPLDANTEDLGVERDAVSESSCSSRFQRVDAAPAGFSRSSVSPFPALGMNAASQQQLATRGANSMNTNAASPHTSAPCLSIVHQSAESEPLCTPSIGLSPQLNISHANSSVLAHCDQSSLAPPCVNMTQTQCGRSALRDAGIAHGSPKALAPSLPMENVPDQSHNALVANSS
ncbi:unnamed protein product, partial [Rhizoctonia solani]